MSAPQRHADVIAGRVAQLGSEVLHDAPPAAIGRARLAQIGVEAVRDTADIPPTRGRVAQAGAETVHNTIPPHSGRCRVVQFGIESVRAVSEVAASGTSRVQVVVICG